MPQAASPEPGAAGFAAAASSGKLSGQSDRCYRARADVMTLAPSSMPEESAPARHVLYVEDDRLNIVLMEEVFRRLPSGWTLECAEDGAQALAALEQPRCPSLVLIDMNLPDMNGLELLARLRAAPRLADLPCVALSADALPEQIEAARAAGFADYWLKPIDVLQLEQALLRLSAA